MAMVVYKPSRKRGRQVIKGRPISKYRRITPARFRAIKPELKFKDTFLVGGALTAPTDASGGEHDPSATIVLNAILQDDGEQDRDGRVVRMESIHIKGQVTCAAQADQTTVDALPSIFIALVCDKQTNGATIVSENVYVNPSANGTLAAFPMRNLAFIKRFQILKTWSFQMDPPQFSFQDSTNLDQASTATTFEGYVKLKGLQTTYSGTAAVVASITDTSLHVIAYTGNQLMAPLISYNARLRFVG